MQNACSFNALAKTSVNFNLLFKFRFGKFTMDLRGWDYHLFIVGKESSINEPEEEEEARRTSEIFSKKFIAMALKARQKWICKYFMQKEKSDVSRQR